MKSTTIVSTGIALFALFASAPRPARAVIIPYSQFRIVQVEAGASDLSVPPYFSDSGAFYTVRQYGDPDYGLFDETQEASASFGLSSGNALSWQTSAFDAQSQSITATGYLQADASTGEIPGWGGGSGAAGNTFNMYFNVDSLVPYNLTTTLNHFVSGEITYSTGLSHILIERIAGTSETILERWFDTDPGGTTITPVTLDPAYVYHLLVEIPLDGQLAPDNNGGASFVHRADYSVVLAPVPEPGTAALLGCGGLCSLGHLWRRRSGGRRT